MVHGTAAGGARTIAHLVHQLRPAHAVRVRRGFGEHIDVLERTASLVGRAPRDEEAEVHERHVEGWRVLQRRVRAAATTRRTRPGLLVDEWRLHYVEERLTRLDLSPTPLVRTTW